MTDTKWFQFIGFQSFASKCKAANQLKPNGFSPLDPIHSDQIKWIQSVCNRTDSENNKLRNSVLGMFRELHRFCGSAHIRNFLLSQISNISLFGIKWIQSVDYLFVCAENQKARTRTFITSTTGLSERR